MGTKEIFKIVNASIKTFNAFNEEVNFKFELNKYPQRNTIFELKLNLDRGKQITLSFKTGNYDFKPKIKCFDAPKEMINNHLEFVKNLIGKTILLNKNNKLDYYEVIDYDVIKSINEKLSILKNPDTISLKVDDYPLYEILILLGFPIMSDNRISIKVLINSEEKEYLINEFNYIISQKEESNFYLLTPDNISIIYNQFYKNNSENRVNPGYLYDSDPDQSYQYFLDEKGILEQYIRYHKSNSSTIRTSREYILVIGQILPKEIANFLEEKGGFSKGYFTDSNKLFIY